MGNGAGVAQILTEAGDLLSLYSKRLQVLRDVFEQSGEWDALQISRQLNDILIENSETQKRLQRVRDSGSSDVLVDVWNISRMKLVYHPVLKDCLKSTALCATWKNRPEILSFLEQKNREIMGDQYHRYVNTSIFPSFVKDHLFHLFGLITNYNAKNPTPLLYRLENLIEWLNKEQPTINSIKGFPVSSMPNPLRRVDDLVLKMDTFRLPQCDANDAEKCDVILSSRHVIVRTVRGKIFRKDETVEHQAVALINLQEAYDDASFEILGIGFTKVLTADSPRTREDWMRSIREVQRFQSGVSSY